MNKSQTGTTLIELMISLVLSLSLIAGIGSLFQQMQKSNGAQHAINDIMDDSRYALEILQKEIRYTGGLRAATSRNGTSAFIFLDINPETNPALPVSPPGSLLLGRDVHPLNLPQNVQFNFANSQYINADLTNAPANDSFMVRYQLVNNGDLNLDVQNNSSSPCTQNSLKDTLYLNPGDPTEAHVVTVYFFVQNGSLACTSQRVVFNPTNPATIFCRSNCQLTDSPAILIDNVARFVASYGVNTDNDFSANYYVSAPNVPVAPTDLWPRILSLRLALVLKSERDNLTQIKVPYYVNGVATTPTDFRIYRVFSTTIALRNQILQ